MRISDNLQRALKERNMTQAELARQTGIDPANISMYCTGAHTPGIDKLVRIADALHVSLDELVGRRIEE